MSNVQVSKYSDFAEKRFLVVDDFPEFRTAIKRMVEAFGGSDVDTASNGEDAVAKIKSKAYHAILCDYNLGDGKDGQQVLEEGKFMGAIKASQIFILLTAENTAEMVMGALEYEPDGYLVKPFTKEMVHNRLMKCINKKRDLMSVFKLVEQKEYNGAIAECDKNIEANPKQAVSYLKLKGKLLLQAKRYDDAVALYEQLLNSKKLPWVLMGLGQAYYYKCNYQQAKEFFDKILELSRVNVEALDWIARAQYALGDKDSAQRTLESAVQLSSKAILRQQYLGDIAYEVGDEEVALKAYKAAVMLGRHSCYRRPLDYFIYAELLLECAEKDDNGRVSLRAVQDAVVALESLTSIYSSDKKIVAPATVMLIRAFFVAKRTDRAKVMLNKAMSFVEKDHVVMENKFMVLLGKMLINAGQADKGKQLIDQYEEKDGSES